MDPIKLSKYIRVEEDISNLHMMSDYLAIKEELSRTTSFGLTLFDSGNTTSGTVIACGDLVTKFADVSPGDTILFSEWQGGRWAFVDSTNDGGEIRVLVMRLDDILAKVI